MKKLIVVFVGLFVLALSVFGQTPNDSIWQVIANLARYVESPEAFAIGATIVAAFITGLFKVEQSWPKRIISWGIPVIGVVVCDLANIGFAALYPIWEAVVAGLFIGLAANGIFTIPQLKPFMDKIHELASKIIPAKE